MADALQRYYRVAAMAALLALTVGCTRPVGDFGRAQTGFTHDVLLPAIGATRASAAGEPVSDFNQTDEEAEMHDRVWRFLVAPHARDWFYDVAVELKRTRIATASAARFQPDRYYQWLRQTDYESSRVRYATVAEHVATDVATAPATFTAICAVIAIDRQRAMALNGVGGLEPAVAAGVAARKAENDDTIGWFVRALGSRHDNYSYALEHLLVETPHEQARLVDVRLSQLAVYLDRARRGDFCSDGRGHGDAEGSLSMPSRYDIALPDAEAGLVPK